MSRDIATINLWDSAETVNATAAITSDPISQNWSSGYCSLLIIVSGSSPSVDITYTVGRTDTDTFYSPVDRDGNSLGALNSTVTSTTWISFSPVLAPYIRIVVTGDGSNGADTGIRAYLVYSEEY